MIDDKAVAKIREHLFTNDNSIYAIIDGAASPDLRFKIYDWEPQSKCLWSGALEPDMQEVAPYMVLLNKDSPFTDWLIEQGWGNHWNIFIESELDFKAFRKQVRKLLLVKSPDGQNLVFRFYDPRVMEIFLPTSEGEQAKDLFDGLEAIFYAKHSSGELMKARLNEESGEVLCEPCV